ncbi:Hypothetical protein, putative [Bodo saltans]|uniref:Uncharacterized protein n=1 Tax=Bodo saltans TaxID=75058 RepID=A0A0S4J5J0_BODSA|nr:Hypothetical protein, putative [Bodo saltans]|eukprot:CUG82379.1 Hypothetical protein, putative [Bodo saltans]
MSVSPPLSILTTSTAGGFLDLICIAARESLLDPASPRRRKKNPQNHRNIDSTSLDEVLLLDDDDATGGGSDACCTFGSWAAISVTAAPDTSLVKIQLPYVIGSLSSQQHNAAAPSQNAHLLDGWSWCNVKLITPDFVLGSPPSHSGHVSLFVDCPCLPHTAGGGGIVGRASSNEVLETSRHYLGAVSSLLEMAPSMWKVSVASSAAISRDHRRGQNSSQVASEERLQLYDVVVTHTEGESGLQTLVVMIEHCVSRIVKSQQQQAGLTTSLPFVVVDVEDMESGKRSCAAWFVLDVLEHHHQTSSHPPDVCSIGRGLAHLATLSSSPQPPSNATTSATTMILNIPNLDLESSNLDATTHDIVQALMATKLLCCPMLVDALVTFPNLVSTSMMLLHQVSPAERGSILDRRLSEWMDESHDAMLRRSLDLEMDDDDAALFSVEDCEAFHAAFVLVAQTVVSWARSARSASSSRSETPERPLRLTRRIEESPPDAHNETVPVTRPDGTTTNVGIDGMSPILGDEHSHVASPLVLDSPLSPLPPQRKLGSTAPGVDEDDDDLHILSVHRGQGCGGGVAPLSPLPAAPSNGHHQRVLSADLLSSGGTFNFSDSIDVMVLKQIQQQQLLGKQVEDDNSSPNPQRGPSLFRMDDSMSVDESAFHSAARRGTELPSTSKLANAVHDALQEEVRVLKATIAVLERERQNEMSTAQDTIDQLRAHIIAEQQQTKRWQSEARNLLSIAQGSLLQVPMNIAGGNSSGVKDYASEASASMTTIPDTPQSPLPLNNSVSSPGELRAARKQRQQQQLALSSSAAGRMFGSSGQFSSSDLNATGLGARTPTNGGTFDDRVSNASSSARHPSFASTSFNLFQSPTASHHRDAMISSLSLVRLMQAQALRRALLESREAKDSHQLFTSWAQDAVHKSHNFLKKTLRKFHDSVESAIKAQHRIAMEALDLKSEECYQMIQTIRVEFNKPSNGEDGIGSKSASPKLSPQQASSLVPPPGISVEADSTSASTVQPPKQFVSIDDSISLANLSMTDASSLMIKHSAPYPMSPDSIFASATPLRTARAGSVRSSFTNLSATPRFHRIISSTPGTAIVSTRPETTQAFIMAGRNLRGEERKSAGERVPNLKFDQIRKEAVAWKQNHLDEYKLFASHQIMFLGDGHVGKSSLIACLTNKAPVLFKKPPQVVTPTLDIRRTRAVVSLDRAHGSAAVIPLGGYPRLNMAEAARICREQSALKEPATLPGSATTCSMPICLTDVPSSILRAPCSLLTPSRASLFCIVFRLSDDEEVSRQAILRYVQHVIGSMLRRGPSSADGLHHQNPSVGDDAAAAVVDVTLPFVLIGTHADQAAANGKPSSASNANHQDLTNSQNALASFRRWLEEEFQAIITGSTKGICPLVLDTFAVSCANWTVYGERPRSADSFSGMLADWAGYLTLYAPAAPAHLLPSARNVISIVDEEGPFSDEDEDTPEETTSSTAGAGKVEAAPVMVDYSWARRGGGSQSGGLFSTTTSTSKSTSLFSSSAAGNASTSSLRDQAIACTERWLHSAAVGLITLFTALYRFTEFTGYVLDASMFDNIVFQHLELAPRMDDERRLSRRLLRTRDVIVEAILGECTRRGYITRLKVPASTTSDIGATEVVVLGTPWLDQILSSVMLPYTIQVASTLPTSSPHVRKELAGVGPRHVVTLLQRAAALGVDLVSSAMPVELASYRVGHVSRKLLFQLLPAPIRAVASTQRNAVAFFTAIGVTPSIFDSSFGNNNGMMTLSRRGDSQDTMVSMMQAGSPTSPQNSFHNATSALGGGGGCSSSSLFIPCVSYVVPQVVVRFLDDVSHLVAEEDVQAAIIQVEMPSMDLFYSAQSRIYQHAVAHWPTCGKDGAPPVGVFSGFSSRNCFMVTINDNVWVLLTAVGGTESDCTYSEYRVAVVRHTLRAEDGAKDSMASSLTNQEDHDEELSQHRVVEDEDDPSVIIKRVADAFGEGPNSHLVSIEGPDGEKRKVEPWAKTDQRVHATLQELGLDDGANSTSHSNTKSREGLRGMMERTERPNLKVLLQLLCLQSA